MGRRARVRLGVVLVVVLVATTLAGCSWLRGGGCGGDGADACLRVLFIGNSYTQKNDLPGTFANLVRSAGGSIEVSMIAPGGAFLADHAADPTVASTIAGTRWTAVVLQEQSLAPASPDVLQSRSIPAVVTLAGLIQADGAQPWLLETWAHRDGWPDLGLDYLGMQDALDAGYQAMSERAGAPIIRAGEAWRRALSEAPTVTLWQDDGSHPTAAGTYLAACTAYLALTGASPVGLVEHGGLSDEDALALQKAAAGQ